MSSIFWKAQIRAVSKNMGVFVTSHVFSLTKVMAQKLHEAIDMEHSRLFKQDGKGLKPFGFQILACLHQAE